MFRLYHGADQERLVWLTDGQMVRLIGRTKSGLYTMLHARADAEAQFLFPSCFVTASMIAAGLASPLAAKEDAKGFRDHPHIGRITVIRYNAPKDRSLLEIMKNDEQSLKSNGFEPSIPAPMRRRDICRCSLPA